MKIIDNTDYETTFTYESADERNKHCVSMCEDGYVITHIWGGRNTNEPISATFRKEQ